MKHYQCHNRCKLLSTAASGKHVLDYILTTNTVESPLATALCIKSILSTHSLCTSTPLPSLSSPLLLSVSKLFLPLHCSVLSNTTLFISLSYPLPPSSSFCPIHYRPLHQSVLSTTTLFISLSYPLPPSSSVCPIHYCPLHQSVLLNPSLYIDAVFLDGALTT